ncbi:quinone-dependent dihydroorotate dehydrogenase [Sphingomonadales bacterium 56]|uniref:quinone-dependent dihydroorotate dehydrogenase n=1 Tax=unclassified Sphingobium TaxID=2611147 RepID=UPI0019191544|nr:MULTISPECIES: quinone-dependent dihydroorotate dehydrogenase [unclassified Sphingobium]MBY2928987.1 quinone-dependent dihydroorotate dehydrogenase [Sphingomonadales bacterium 56]MBY2959161.1 quinone-dependent dihydroorotate dehydrogenase [Sphingomonadales bacterium 58]CAD7338328.1 Dihydroorotate dehydrogenase (quinone) [Sphingobium sp. S6]CAD7338641.1 Dihydroorotate dehydrogenase (quinone) [Sphingobium sp. S8]
MSYRLVRPLFFALDAERAHHLSVALLRMMPFAPPPAPDAALTQTVAGISFPNPVGLAAGYDKEGLVAHKMHALGFGFAELGTLTPMPQPGNPQPRLFRLVEDRAVINRMGFNNGGLAAAAERVAKRRRPAGQGAAPVIGINIGANKDAADRIADYVTGVTCMAPLADYLTVNISSPNTPGLRALQDRAALDQLLAAVMAARGADSTPIFLKVAPDLEPADVEDIAAACLDHQVDALIVSNTTISRPPLRSAHAGESGGLSGAPLTNLSLQRIRDFRRILGNRLPLIGVGGIGNAEQAYARLRAGASLIQLYSALVYEGPYLAKRINAGLKKLMARDGFTHISDVVGIDS